MINDLRFELSFKNIFQLEKKLRFCKINNINKINIPCKGILKKEFLSQSIEYIGENYSELDVIYHYSLFHQYTKNSDISFFEFINFINTCTFYKNKEILIVSGTNKKKNFEVLNVLENLQNKKKDLQINIGIAYNPYLNKHYDIPGERERFEKKISSGLIKSVWLQYGTDINLLNNEINFLKKSIFCITNKTKDQSIKLFGSLLIPSKQFISRFKFRPWKGVYISNKYLYSVDEFHRFTKYLIDIYLENNICPVIETEFCTLEKLEVICNLFKI